MKLGYYYQIDGNKIGIVEEDGEIVELTFGEVKNEQEIEIQETVLLQKAKGELEEYFFGERRKFDLPLNPKGTEFQKKVWNALQAIPYGETRTYEEIAIQIGNPKTTRAVGMANHNNPIGIIIPCHRVIGKNGKLTGYAGGLDKKEKLLKLEEKHKMK